MVGPHQGREHGYETPRPDVQAHVPLEARRILELGCSTGALGAALKRRQPAVVVGVEIDETYALEASRHLDRVIVSNVEDVLRGPALEEAPFDCLVIADVLEHLVNPWRTLDQAVAMLSPRATVVISVPNVAECSGIWRLLREGRWPRDDEGLFDRTHLQWFTRADAVDLVQGAGLQIMRVEPRYWSGGGRLRLQLMLAKTPLHRFLAAQYIVSATKPR